MADEYDKKKKKLNEFMERMAGEGVCVAFSGGVDSSVVLKAAAEAGKKKNGVLFGVMFDTFLHPKGDEETARRVAAECGAVFAVISVNEMENPAILDNPPDRCYQCKKFLFTRLGAFAEAHHCRIVMDGTNADDHGVYRPGLRAVSELGVKSPLAACGFTKEDVRRLAAEYGISVAGKPSNSCLATRLPYGQRLEAGLLRSIEEGEGILAGMGFRQVRLRIHGGIARIEVEAAQIPEFAARGEEITALLKPLGFRYITLDLEGFRSGSMDIGQNTGQ